MNISMGTDSFEWPSSELGQLRDSHAILGDTKALHERINEDGYLYIKNFFDRTTVGNARKAILMHLQDKDNLASGKPLLEGVMSPKAKTVLMAGYKNIVCHEALRNVFESRRLFDFYDEYFAEPSCTYAYKWLRAVDHQAFTGSHYDVVYMGRGSERVHTSWIPFGDLSPATGTLAICSGSHKDERFERLRNTYGKVDVDRDKLFGWYTSSPREILQKFGGQWLTSDFQMGDMVIFGMYTMHCSTTNSSPNYRLSADIRFQPKADKIDARWAGKCPEGHGMISRENVGASMPFKSIEEAKLTWDKQKGGQEGSVENTGKVTES